MLSSAANLVISRPHMYTRFTANSAKKYIRTHQIVSPDSFVGHLLILLFVLLVLYFGCCCRSARQASACCLCQHVQDELHKLWY